MNGLQNTVYEVHKNTHSRRVIARFREPADGILFVDAMVSKGADVFMIDYAGDPYHGENK